MAIKAHCSGCKTKLTLKDQLAGKRIKCPHCGQVQVISVTPDQPAPSPTKQPPLTSRCPKPNQASDYASYRVAAITLLRETLAEFKRIPGKNQSRLREMGTQLAGVFAACDPPTSILSQTGVHPSNKEALGSIQAGLRLLSDVMAADLKLPRWIQTSAVNSQAIGRVEMLLSAFRSLGKNPATPALLTVSLTARLTDASELPDNSLFRDRGGVDALWPGFEQYFREHELNFKRDQSGQIDADRRLEITITKFDDLVQSVTEHVQLSANARVRYIQFSDGPSPEVIEKRIHHRMGYGGNYQRVSQEVKGRGLADEVGKEFPQLLLEAGQLSFGVELHCPNCGHPHVTTPKPEARIVRTCLNCGHDANTGLQIDTVSKLREAKQGIFASLFGIGLGLVGFSVGLAAVLGWVEVRFRLAIVTALAWLVVLISLFGGPFIVIMCIWVLCNHVQLYFTSSRKQGEESSQLRHPEYVQRNQQRLSQA